MSVVGVNIGTEFGAKNCESNCLELAYEALSCASNIVNHIANREADSKFEALLAENDFLRRIDNQTPLRECAKLIICLMKISANVDFNKRSPIVCVDLGDYGSLKDTSIRLLETTMRLRDSFDPDGNFFDRNILYHEILNSVRHTCAVAAKFGETDLEVYIAQQFMLAQLQAK